MTRHQRNATASTVYTYHERRKDAKASGYGTLEERLTKEAIKEFDCCSLTLQPCRDPVITPEGVLYDKEAILEYILHRKREFTKQMKEYEKRAKKDELELEELARIERETKARKFVEAESTPAHPGCSKSSSSSSASNISSVSNMAGSKAKNVPSFWVPSSNGSATTSKNDDKLKEQPKPDSKVYCPISGAVLKLKDLIPVKFTPLEDEKEKNNKNGVGASSFSSVRGKTQRYKCAISGDVLTNSTPCAVLKTSGHVVTMDCIDRIIKKDWIDPTNGAKVTQSDIIPLTMGGTGFAAANEKLRAKLARPVMELT